LKGENDLYAAVRDADLSFSMKLYHEHKNIDVEKRTRDDPDYDLTPKEIEFLRQKKVRSFETNVKPELSKNVGKLISQKKSIKMEN